MTLEFARSAPVEPGSNQRGEQADTTWLFLLPSLELGEVVVVGRAPSGTLVALEKLARRLVVVRGARARPAAVPGLVYVTSGQAGRLARDEQAVGWLRQVLESGGLVYVAPSAWRRSDAALDLARRLGISTAIELGTPDDRAAVTVPAKASAWLIPAAPQPVSALARRALGIARRARLVLLRALRRSTGDPAARVSEFAGSVGLRTIGPLPDRPPARSGTLLRNGNEPGDAQPPAYLAKTAAAAGAPLASSEWRLSPPRGYRSQKVIFFARLENAAPVVVKLTQDPHFNRFLENEAAALERLGSVGVGDHLVVPRLRFRGEHAGLTVIAQDALEGRAFVRAAEPGARSEHLASVMRALGELARGTLHAGEDVGPALHDLVARYRATYHVSPAAARRLEDHAEVLGALGDELPLVFMHGDATVYNTLLGAEGRVGLVDWENAEPSGLPLWDLFHFEKAHAEWTAEREAVRYTPGHFAASFLEDAPSAAITASCRDLGVPELAVEPLRYVWLAWHALRDARQLAPERLEAGFHHRVLAGALRP